MERDGHHASSGRAGNADEIAPIVASADKASSFEAGPPSAKCENNSSSRRSRLLKMADAFVVLFSCTIFVLTFTVFTPLVPLVAEEKQANAVVRGTAVGLVYTVTLMTAVLVSPVLAKEIPRAGPRLVFVLGGVLLAGCGFLMGFLDQIQSWTQFIVIIYFIGMVQGVAWAGSVDAGLCLLLAFFPTSPGAVMAATEISLGLAFAGGTALGGILWHFGGNRLLLSGIAAGLLASAAVILCSIMAFLSGRSSSYKEDIKQQTPAASTTNPVFWDYLRHPMNILSLLLIFVSQTVQSFSYPVLSPYLKHRFHVHDSLLGFGVTANNGAYSLGSLIIGHVVDRYGPRRFVVLGFLVAVVGSFLLGPPDFFGITPSLGSLFVGLVVQGLGCSWVIVPMLALNLERMPGHFSISSRAAMIGTSQRAAVCLGVAAGAVISGKLTPVIGYPNLSMITVTALLVSLVVFLIASLCEKDGPLPVCLRSWLGFGRSPSQQDKAQPETIPLTEVN